MPHKTKQEKSQKKEIYSWPKKKQKKKKKKKKTSPNSAWYSCARKLPFYPPYSCHESHSVLEAATASELGGLIFCTVSQSGALLYQKWRRRRVEGRTPAASAMFMEPVIQSVSNY